MSSSVVPPASRHNSPRNAARVDQNKGSRRGRPMKETSDDVSEQRRAQVRRAQETFRRRKQAAIESLEQRVVSLEDCVEQMSNVFLDFTNSMFDSGTLKDDKKLSKSLFEATSRIIALAKIVVHEDGEEKALTTVVDTKILATQGTQSTEREIHTASGDSDTLLGTKPNYRTEGLETLEPVEDPIIPNPASSQVVNATEPPYSLATDALNPYSVFGNGWFDRKPPIVLRSSGRNSGGSQLEESLAMKVLESTLRLAYFALLGSSPNMAELQQQIFRFSFLYHSREEILFNLRWFLGPGRNSLPVLGHASFGPNNFENSPLNPENFNFGIGAPSTLNPFVDVSAIEDAHSKLIKSDLLNAVGIESYLRKIGAVYIDQNVIQMEIQAPGELSTGQGSPLAYSEKNEELRFDEMNDLLPQESGSSFGSGIFGTPRNSSLPFLDSFSVPDPVGSPEQPSALPLIRHMVTLNAPLLLQNLAAISMCLGKGPGYLQKDVDQAIVSSVLQIAG